MNKNIWKDYAKENRKPLEEFCNGYKNYISEYKTERECVLGAIEMAKQNGYINLDDAIKNNISLVNMDYVCSVKDKTGNIIGFGLLVPSIAKASKKSNGKLFPFGIFRLLKALHGKNDTLEMYFVGVKSEFQKLGVTGILINHILKMCIKNGIKYCETGPELELNEKVQSLWKSFDTRNHKRRRCWKKEI